MNSGLVSYKRVLKLELPERQSAFLWGARKTGKSTFLKEHFPNCIRYDLLESDLVLRLLKEPHRLREEILLFDEKQLRHPIIIDEIQKIPTLLDEVHWLIENKGVHFILCGSSARKLKRTGVNLLGGRAWRYSMFPLVYKEIPDFDLLRALNAGLVPSHYRSSNYRKSLKAYIIDYLNQEIKEEGLVRNLAAFARFLDSLAFSHGELTNYSNIASDCGVDAKTVQEYYQILVDTHLGYRIGPFAKRVSRDLIRSMPKFYLFDVGVATHISKNSINALQGEIAGKAFEHFILMELVAYCGYSDLDFSIQFWRTKTGLEVDFILDRGAIAIEVKISDRIGKHDLKGLLAFTEEHKTKKAFLVSNEKRARRIQQDTSPIDILPWKTFLDLLWNGEVIA